MGETGAQCSGDSNTAGSEFGGIPIATPGSLSDQPGADGPVSPSAPDDGELTSGSRPTEIWRVGRSVGRTIYRQRGEDPAKGDELVGLAGTRQTARWIADALNGTPRAGGRYVSLGRLVYASPPNDPLNDFVAAMDSADLARRVADSLNGSI